MPVKIGNSYVSEAALNYAQSKVTEESNSKKNSSSNVLGELSKQFKDINFSIGTQPFNGSGTNNISIAPNILRQMANDPEKRLEYEALIYDCNQGLKDTANRPGLKAQGYIIGSDGGLRMWSIGSSDDGQQKRSILNVDKDKLAGHLPKKKKSPVREIQEKLLKKSEDTINEELSTTTGKTTVTFNESKRSRQLAAAQTVDDVKQLLELLQTDLEDCENGLKNGWCDEEEVAKVKKMIERAQKRMNEVAKNQDEEKIKISFVDILI